jgi:hypothetical protein
MYAGGNGGDGIACSVSGNRLGGGGVGGNQGGNPGSASDGGGGSNSAAGSSNTGGGGGGNGGTATGGNGGSGVVYIKSNLTALTTSGNPTQTTVSGGYLYKFTGSGSISF